MLDSFTVYYEDGNSFAVSEQTKIEYTSNNLLQKMTILTYDNSTGLLEFSEIDSFGYTGNIPVYSFYQEKFIAAGFPDTAINRTIRYLNTNGIPDSAQFQYYTSGGWEDDMKLKYTYNSFNNPTTIKGINPDGSAVGQFNFYYETYDDGNNVGIEDVATLNPFSIYPNPFGNLLNIAWKNERTSATISLINMVGQTVFSSNKYLATGNNSLNLPELSNGNYILLIQDDKGNTYNSKLVRK